MIEEIGRYIASLTGKTVGRDFFIGHRPLKRADKTDVPARHTLVLENTPGATDGDWPDYVQKEIQLVHRATSYFTARADAVAAFTALHGLAGVELPVITSGEVFLANTIDAVGDPRPIANPNDQNFFDFSTNYIFKITRPD